VLLAMGFSPLVRAIEHQTVVPVGTKRLPRWLAILVVYMAIVGVLTVVALLVIPALVNQAEDLWTRLPGWFDRAQTFLIEHGWLSRRVTIQEAVRRAPASPEQAVGTFATAVGRLIGFIVAAITILILTFYLLVDSFALFAAFARLFPTSNRLRVEEAARKITVKVSAWLVGQLILAGTIGVTASIGLYLMGVPYFYVLGVLAAIGELIPVIGPMLSAVPAVLAALAVSPHTAFFVLLFWIAQQQIESHVLVPKLMQHQVGVSPVIIIAALLIGGSVLGILGAVLAVPTAAILQVLLQEVIAARDMAEERL
jgi:predicted PurR-regulated permease PerM